MGSPARRFTVRYGDGRQSVAVADALIDDKVVGEITHAGRQHARRPKSEIGAALLTRAPDEQARRSSSSTPAAGPAPTAALRRPTSAERV
jgi:hypothetical protein